MRAHAVHAGVDLDVDRHRSAHDLGSIDRRLDTLSRGEREGESGCHRSGHDVRWWLREEQDWRGDVGIAQLETLVHDGHRETLSAAVEKGQCSGHRSMAVAVSLDDGTQRGRRDPARHRPSIRPEGVTIHLSPCRTRQALNGHGAPP